MHGTQFIKDPLGFPSGIVEQADVRLIGDIGRSTGGINDEFALLAGTAVSVVIAIFFLFPVLRLLLLLSQMELQKFLLQCSQTRRLQPLRKWVSIEALNGAACWQEPSPMKNCRYGFSLIC